MLKTWTVVYKTGGYANAEWHRTLAFQTFAEAEACAADVRRGGREANVVVTSNLEGEYRND